MAMQFVVPQFIEVESKVIGPISVRQFIILLITAGFIYLFWEMFTFWIAAIMGVFSLAIGGTFAFVRINSQPFHIFALSFIQTMKNPKLKIWQREIQKVIVKKAGKEISTKEKVFVPKKAISQSRLSELSLQVDTGGVYRPDDLSRKVKQTGKL